MEWKIRSGLWINGDYILFFTIPEVLGQEDELSIVVPLLCVQLYLSAKKYVSLYHHEFFSPHCLNSLRSFFSFSHIKMKMKLPKTPMADEKDPDFCSSYGIVV